MNPDLLDIVFLDIETVARTDQFNALDERMKTQWVRKAGFIRKEEGQSEADLFGQRAGIYAEFGKIVCVALGKLVDAGSGKLTLRLKGYSGRDEKTLLETVNNTLQRLDAMTVRLCAHNGKEFDFPYLCRRLLVNGLPLPSILDLSGKKPWEVPHVDTLEMWKFGDYKHYTSLDLLAALFDIPSSKGDMDGSQVHEVYYREGDLERIQTYCYEDVTVLAKLYLKMTLRMPEQGISVEYA